MISEVHKSVPVHGETGHPEQRSALFISHASPEDNAFTLWLGAKLAALGYQVFADVFRLRGGDDWERVLEAAIRDKAAKVLLVGTPHGVQKQGVRNEITIALETAKRIGDSNFVIPLRLAAFDAPLQIAHAQYIDFAKGWAQGLGELLSLLTELSIPTAEKAPQSALWQAIQLKDARTIAPVRERLVSNWLSVGAFPERIVFYDFKAGISIGKAQSAIRDAPLPVVPFNRGFLAFAPLHQLQDYFGPDLPLEVIAKRDTRGFLDHGWPDLHIAAHDARAKFSDLVRRGLDHFFETKGLKSFEFASERLAWWPTASHATLKRIPFNWSDGRSGSRQIVGHSRKRGFHWHYGVTCWARSAPVRHVRVAGRVVFTSDGQDPIGDAKRLHRMRRSFCKSWRNDKWRDLLQAFLFWIADGAKEIAVPMGDGAALKLTLPPVTIDVGFGIDAPEDNLADADVDDDDDDHQAARGSADDDGSDNDPEEWDDEE